MSEEKIIDNEILIPEKPDYTEELLSIIKSGKSNAEIRELLTLIRDANMNIIRIHGGGPVNKECF